MYFMVKKSSKRLWPLNTVLYCVNCGCGVTAQWVMCSQIVIRIHQLCIKKKLFCTNFSHSALLNTNDKQNRRVFEWCLRRWAILISNTYLSTIHHMKVLALQPFVGCVVSTHGFRVEEPSHWIIIIPAYNTPKPEQLLYFYLLSYVHVQEW